MVVSMSFSSYMKLAGCLLPLKANSQIFLSSSSWWLCCAVVGRGESQDDDLLHAWHVIINVIKISVHSRSAIMILPPVEKINIMCLWHRKKKYWMKTKHADLLLFSTCEREEPCFVVHVRWMGGRGVITCWFSAWMTVCHHGNECQEVQWLQLHISRPCHTKVFIMWLFLSFLFFTYSIEDKMVLSFLQGCYRSKNLKF